MAKVPKTKGGGKGSMLVKAWPLIIAAYERWERLSPEEKEEYKERARDYAARGREAIEAARQSTNRRPKRRFPGRGD